MAGLLGDVLPYVYSRGNALRRGLLDMVENPGASMEQTAGLLMDKGNEQRNVLAQAFANPKQPFQVTDPNALRQATQGVMNGLMGFAPVGMLAGVGAKTANQAALAKAQELEKQGAAPEVIWQQTGWGKGPDLKWRFEIDDSTARPLQRTWGEAQDLKAGNTTTTKRQRALAHPGLSAAYPESKSIGVTLKPGTSTDGAYFDGAFGPSVNASANPRYGFKPDPSVMLHELQHYIQQREGFSQGGAPGQRDIQDFAQQIFNANKAEFLGDPKQLMQMAQHQAYQRLSGEAEARLVQARQNLTPEQRSAQFPWAPDYFQEATGVPLNSLIFR